MFPPKTKSCWVHTQGKQRWWDRDQVTFRESCYRMARRVVQQTLRAYNIGLDVLSVQLVRLLLAYVWKETRDSLAGIQHTRSVAMTTSVESFFPVCRVHTRKKKRRILFFGGEGLCIFCYYCLSINYK